MEHFAQHAAHASIGVGLVAEGVGALPLEAVAQIGGVGDAVRVAVWLRGEAGCVRAGPAGEREDVGMRLLVEDDVAAAIGPILLELDFLDRGAGRGEGDLERVVLQDGELFRHRRGGHGRGPRCCRVRRSGAPLRRARCRWPR